MKSSNKYIVSVVTPFYNVDLKLFQKCFKSLQNQTLGFENIEWIVVIHNSKKEYLDGAKEITNGYDNVHLYELNNDRHTPSSPRNYGLNFVKGKFIGFLDADDTYNPDCLEKATKHLIENNAQIAMFRMETESADPARLAVRQLIFFNQTQEMVLLEKGKWDSHNLIYGAALNVCAKLYDAEYLRKENIKFDEDVPFAEDNMFNLSAFARADKICILPQLIGYKYYLNAGSMVQTFNKTWDEVRRYAVGFKKVFDTGINEGIFMDYIICDLLGYESAILLASKAIRLKHRKEIKKLLGPYIKLVKPIQESKLYPKKLAKTLIKLPKIVINHPYLLAFVGWQIRLFRVDVDSKIQALM